MRVATLHPLPICRFEDETSSGWQGHKNGGGGGGGGEQRERTMMMTLVRRRGEYLRGRVMETRGAFGHVQTEPQFDITTKPWRAVWFGNFWFVVVGKVGQVESSAVAAFVVVVVEHPRLGPSRASALGAQFDHNLTEIWFNLTWGEKRPRHRRCRGCSDFLLQLSHSVCLAR
jgi:hypothetical protein